MQTLHNHHNGGLLWIIQARRGNLTPRVQRPSPLGFGYDIRDVCVGRHNNHVSAHAERRRLPMSRSASKQSQKGQAFQYFVPYHGVEIKPLLVATTQ
jgi:hypothetical protein